MKWIFSELYPCEVYWCICQILSSSTFIVYVNNSFSDGSDEYTVIEDDSVSPLAEKRFVGVKPCPWTHLLIFIIPTEYYFGNYFWTSIMFIMFLNSHKLPLSISYQYWYCQEMLRKTGDNAETFVLYYFEQFANLLRLSYASSLLKIANYVVSWSSFEISSFILFFANVWNLFPQEIFKPFFVI